MWNVLVSFPKNKQTNKIKPSPLLAMVHGPAILCHLPVIDLFALFFVRKPRDAIVVNIFKASRSQINCLSYR